MDYWLPIIVLFGAFFFVLALGVPIVYAIGYRHRHQFPHNSISTQH